MLRIESTERRVHDHRSTALSVSIQGRNERQGDDLLLPSGPSSYHISPGVDDLEPITVVDPQALELRLVCELLEHVSSTRFDGGSQLLSEPALRGFEHSGEILSEAD